MNLPYAMLAAKSCALRASGACARAAASLTRAAALCAFGVLAAAMLYMLAWFAANAFPDFFASTLGPRADWLFWKTGPLRAFQQSVNGMLSWIHDDKFANALVFMACVLAASLLMTLACAGLKIGQIAASAAGKAAESEAEKNDALLLALREKDALAKSCPPSTPQQGPCPPKPRKNRL